MAQNWWDKYPKVMPLPAKLPLPLPGPGGVMPGAGMGIPTLPPAAFGAMPPSLGGFDPSYFAGGGYMGDKLLDRAPLKAPFAAGQGARPAGPSPAIQWAVEAIRNGADPKAVRARLQQMGSGNPEVDPSGAFSDLAPGGQQVPATMNSAVDRQQMLPPGQSQFAREAMAARDGLNAFGDGAVDRMALIPGAGNWKTPGIVGPDGASPDRNGAFTGGQAGPGAKLYPAAYAQDHLDTEQDWTVAYELARQKGGDPQDWFQMLRGRPSRSPPSEARPIGTMPVNPRPRPNNPPAPNLTPWQIRRRNENAALLADPRIRAFLDMISYSEGNTNYDSLFGNHHGTFTDRSTHPGNQGELYHGVRQGAAGRYQIEPRTYAGLNRLLGPFTMSDRDQDLMAVELIREGRAWEALRAGRLDQAISRLGQRQAWASFPVLVNGRWGNNPSHQLTRNFEELRARYQEALNRYSRPGPGLEGSAASLGQ